MTMTTTTTSRDGQALLDAILDEPEDDFHRLAYADWLEETGGEWERQRGAFIRDRLPWPGVQKLNELLPGYEVVVGGRGVRCDLFDQFHTLMRGGFFCEIAMAHDHFLAHAADVFCRHPVGRVVLTDCEPADTGPEHFLLYDHLDTPPSQRRPWWLHSSLYGLLSMSEAPRHKWRVYPSRQAALDDLEAACLLFGLALRKKAREERCP